MEPNFTPGPWQVDGSYICQESDMDVGICDVLFMDGRKTWFHGPVTDSSARLIAASPELFAALAAMREYLSKCVPHAGDTTGADWGRVMDQSHAALMKATGGQA